MGSLGGSQRGGSIPKALARYVQHHITRAWMSDKATGTILSLLAVLLYILADVSYTVAVFTDPGSSLAPLRDANKAPAYASLPTQESEPEPEQQQPSTITFTSLTAKSTGRPRYCKKCQAVKPDRAHHCSTCHRCVLKMDHHCPWLATCVGMRNYKSFLLFLCYTSLFCWVCFGATAQWVWIEVVHDVQLDDGAMLVHTILLAVLSGIIGLVLTGFTAWHLYLALSGQTTIESLEKTRYLSPLKKSMENQIRAERTRHYVNDPDEDPDDPDDERPLVDRFKEIHANALPGITRPEEGDDRSTTSSPIPMNHTSYSSPGSARDSLRRSYAQMEEARERDRYAAYLDELDSAKMPHAFDLGWRRNLTHVFGETPALWLLPVCNTPGNGWNWDVSGRWIEARDELARERVRAQMAEQGQGWDAEPVAGRELLGPDQGIAVGGAGRHYAQPTSPLPPPPKQQQQAVPMQPIGGRGRGRRPEQDDGDADEYESSSDEQDSALLAPHAPRSTTATENWNDVPDDFLSSRRAGTGAGAGAGTRSRSRGRRKGD